jgi:hypothetical protein
MKSQKTLAETATNDVVTIVIDPKNPLGKRFAADGSKSSNVTVSMGLAEQRHVPTAQSMADVIKEVSENSNAAIINASFPAVPAGETFLIFSERLFANQLNLTERAQMQGVHNLKVGERDYKVLGRFKENTLPSTWQLLDRDIDRHTPIEYADLDYDAWLSKMEPLLPGLAAATRIQTLSSSARVTKDGLVVGGGNGHTWVQLVDANDVERVRTALHVNAMALGLSWKKPRYSRSEPGKIVGHGFATIVDQSVWTPGRFVFNGKPTVDGGLVVKPQVVTIVAGNRLDTSRVVLPAMDKLPAITRAAGFEMQVHARDGGQFVISAQDLSLDTEIELSNGSTTTVRDALANLPDGEKLRCQTPFRASVSVAAFLSRGSSGKPFVHDVGTSTTHWLNDREALSLGHPPLAVDGLPLPELLEHLKAMSKDELAHNWASASANLNSQDLERVMKFVSDETGSPRRVLNAALKDVAAARKRERTQQRAAQRETIFFTPEDMTRLTAKTEDLILESANESEFLSFGGVLSQLLDKEIPYTHVIDDSGGAAPQVQVLEPIDQYGMRAMVERVAVFQALEKGDFKNIAVPNKIIETMIFKKKHAAPVVTGLLTHPIVLTDGSIVSEEGLHKPSGLLLHGRAMAGVTAYSRPEAQAAIGRLRTYFLAGFEFETPMDATVALSALFTGVVRRVLDIAPGYVFLAPIQSSGKTTLARRIHVILTGRDMPVSNFAANDEQEMQKRMLAMLMTSPAMICLDNVTDGTTFSSSAISMVMTSPVFKQRILGGSKEAECPTNVLFVATGNNLSLGQDELTRWLPVYLNPRSARPQERLFEHPDVVAHALHMRADILRDVVGIIAGYHASSESMPTGTRFARWDRMVRQPILWAGGDDVADVFRANADNSEANGAAVALLTSLKTLHGTSEFSASTIAIGAAQIARSENISATATMVEALTAMRCKDPRSEGSVGRALRSIVDRRVPVEDGDLTLKKRLINGLTRYRVA